MADIDIRWKQRFSNYIKAFKLLEEAIEMRELSKLEEEGLIQRFEYTYELAWNTLKDYLEYQGFTEIKGARDAITQAFNSGIIPEGDEWLNMIRSRSRTSHRYSREELEEILNLVRNTYYKLFKDLSVILQKEINSGK